MEPDTQESPELTPRKRRGLVVVVLAFLVLVVVIFIGMNLSHYKQAKEGEPVGASANVAGPDNR
ncbi:hypothetical protein [Sphingomonas sp. KR3-1]|uniref:hypothetical protein n=1 Tax=Sphingomonas sp. KR3-1 TaxID=3156611 RepID=UPI0032B4169B